MKSKIFGNVYLCSTDELAKGNDVTIDFKGSILERAKHAARASKEETFRLKLNAEVLIYPENRPAADATLLVIEDKNGNIKQAPIVNGRFVFS